MLAAAALVLALAGCGKEVDPPVQVEIQRVEVPVAQPCLPADKIPTEPGRIGDTLTGDSQHDLPLVAASALELRQWGETMMAALLACTAIPPAATPSP
jgi:hypothetical protein